MNKTVAAAVSHHEREVAELRADRDLAVEYLKAAMESLDDPDNRAAGLLALRTVAEAYGGLGAAAAEALTASGWQPRRFLVAESTHKPLAAKSYRSRFKPRWRRLHSQLVVRTNCEFAGDCFLGTASLTFIKSLRRDSHQWRQWPNSGLLISGSSSATLAIEVRRRQRQQRIGQRS